MNHTQKELIRRAREIRNEEADYASWGGPDPRGKSVKEMRLKKAAEFEEIAALKEPNND